MTRSRGIFPRLLLAGLLVTGAAVGGTGCTRDSNRGVSDSEMKQAWDSSRSAELEDSLRNRLATTQRDN